MKNILLITVGLILAVSARAQSPSAIASAPENVKAGNEFTISVTIEKFDLEGFAQYVQKLPEGFKASEISGMSDNANFYFENNKVMFQWYKLPVDRDKIVISFSVTPDKSATGKIIMPGYFEYKINNRRGVAQTETTVDIQ